MCLLLIELSVDLSKCDIFISTDFVYGDFCVLLLFLSTCILLTYALSNAIYPSTFHAHTGEWSSVRDTISRAEHTVMGDIDDPLFHQKLRAAHGIAHLAEGRYLEAAKSFTSVSPELTNQFNSVISAEDLAMYGALLGLATLDRGTLHSLVIDGVFKGRLEVSVHSSVALNYMCLGLFDVSS